MQQLHRQAATTCSWSRKRSWLGCETVFDVRACCNSKTHILFSRVFDLYRKRGPLALFSIHSQTDTRNTHTHCSTFLLGPDTLSRWMCAFYNCNQPAIRDVPQDIYAQPTTRCINQACGERRNVSFSESALSLW